jgi:radical SAM protein with 4Fe4S-binding SPASM domain
MAERKPVEHGTGDPVACPERPRVDPRLHLEPLKTGGQEVQFVLDPESPSWALLNDAGLRVLNLCNGERTAADMAREIAPAQGLAPGELQPQIEAYLQQLAASRLLGNAPRRAPGELPEKNRFHGIALEITRRCNLQCRHCYLAAGEPGERELTTEELERLIRQVRGAGGTSVSIGGGEPLLHPDWHRLVELALSLDLLVALGTNGTLINAPLAEELAALPIKIQLSLDGATADVHDAIRGEGSYGQTRRAIDLLKVAGKGEDLVVAFTPMKLNVREVSALIDLMEALEIRVVQFPPLARSGRARRDWQVLELDDAERLALWRTVHGRAPGLKGRMDLLADCFSLSIDRPGVPYRCNIGSQLRIDPDGNCYPCQCFHAGRSFRLGNVRERSIAEIAFGARLRSIVEGCLTRPERIPACSDCRWMNLCGAGCMGNAYECNGDALTVDGCRVREQWLRELFAARIGVAPAARDDTADQPQPGP